MSSGGRIEILTGLSPAAEFMVPAHEYAYELLHHGADRSASRDARELEAEAVASLPKRTGTIAYWSAMEAQVSPKNRNGGYF